MGILDKFRRGDDAQTFTYQCSSCKNTFESDESHMGRVRCPACGDHNVRELVA